MGLKLPVDIKVALAKKGMSFRQWTKEKGFNYRTAFAVATGVIQAKRKNTKSHEIKKAIEEELLGG